jgi:hypothetical protein
MTAPLTPQRPMENVGRGAALALLAIPVGVIIWSVIANFGFYASIVSFVVAAAAVWLYRRGSGGIISRSGAWVVLGVVVVTLILSFFAEMVIGSVGGFKNFSLIGDPRFWPLFWGDFSEIFKSDLPSFGLGLLFAALGCFRVLGRAFATAHQTSSTTATFGTAPEAPAGTYIPAQVSAPAPAPAPAPASAPVASPAPAAPQLNPESTGTISSAPDDRTPPATPRD